MSRQGEGEESGFLKRLKPSCVSVSTAMPHDGPGYDPAGKPNIDQEHGFSPGEFTEHKEQKADVGDVFCLKQSGLGRSAVSKMIHEAFGEEALAEGQSRHCIRKALSIWGRWKKRSIWK